jgi:hypothetical protein
VNYIGRYSLCLREGIRSTFAQDIVRTVDIRTDLASIFAAIKGPGLFFVIALCILLAACGGVSGGSQVVSSDTDACSILSAQDVGQILGATVTAQSMAAAPSSVSGAKSSGCGYQSSDMSAYASVALSIAPDSSTAQTAFNIMKGSGTAVSGLGDDAVSQGATLIVLKDNAILVVGAATKQSGPNVDLEKQLAQKALGHL